jgi:uncharacterized membrane protein YphA (DoxX/SURF4 family)
MKINEFLNRKPVLLFSRVILGALFIYASLDKILDPLSFAQIIHHYRISPPDLINFIAITLPWVEFIAGLFLIIGVKIKGSSLTIIASLIFFIVILSITAIRGINVSCGCFSTSMVAKSNLIVKIIEDIGMLALGFHIYLFNNIQNK